MAFNISYTYQLIDKFSGPLKKVTKAQSLFQKGIRKSTEGVNRLSSKLNAGNRVAGGYTHTMKTTAASMGNLSRATRETKQTAEALSKSTERANRSLKKMTKTSGRLRGGLRRASSSMSTPP